MHATHEHGDAHSFGDGATFHAHAGHLSAAHMRYVSRWLSMVAVEERSSLALARYDLSREAYQRIRQQLDERAAADDGTQEKPR